MAEVRDVLREVRLTIGSEGDKGERERQQARVKRVLLAMGVAEEDLDNEFRDHKQQQEAVAAAGADEAQLNGVDALVGVAGGVPSKEGVGEVSQNADVDMEVEGAADINIELDQAVLGRPEHLTWHLLAVCNHQAESLKVDSSPHLPGCQDLHGFIRQAISGMIIHSKLANVMLTLLNVKADASFVSASTPYDCTSATQSTYLKSSLVTWQQPPQYLLMLCVHTELQHKVVNVSRWIFDGNKLTTEVMRVFLTCRICCT